MLQRSTDSSDSPPVSASVADIEAATKAELESDSQSDKSYREMKKEFQKFYYPKDGKWVVVDSGSQNSRGGGVIHSAQRGPNGQDIESVAVSMIAIMEGVRGKRVDDLIRQLSRSIRGKVEMRSIQRAGQKIRNGALANPHMKNINSLLAYISRPPHDVGHLPYAISEWFGEDSPISMNSATYAVVLTHFSKRNKRKELLKWLDTASEELGGLETQHYTPIIEFYSMMGDTKAVGKLFNEVRFTLKLPMESRFLTAVAAAYARVGDMRNTLQVLQLLQEEVAPWTSRQYNELLHACAKAHDIERMELWYQTMLRDGVAPNKYTYQSMIPLYTQKGMIDKCEWIVREMEANSVRVDDSILHNVMAVYANAGHMEECMHFFKQLCANYHPTSMSYAIILKGYSLLDDVDQFFSVYNSMRQNGHKPDVRLQAMSLQLCKRTNNLDLVRNVTSSFIGLKKEEYNILLSTYGKKNTAKQFLEIATTIKREHIRPDVYTYNSLIQGYSMIGKPRKGVEFFFEAVRDKRVELTDITFAVSLDAAGFLNDFALIDKIWDRATMKYSQCVNANVLSSYIEALGRSAQNADARNGLAVNMKITEVFINACRFDFLPTPSYKTAFTLLHVLQRTLQQRGIMRELNLSDRIASFVEGLHQRKLSDKEVNLDLSNEDIIALESLIANVNKLLRKAKAEAKPILKNVNAADLVGDSTVKRENHSPRRVTNKNKGDIYQKRSQRPHKK